MILVSGTKVGHWAGGGERQFLRAQLHGFDGLAFTTQRTVIKGLDLVAACGAFFNLLRKHVDAHTLVRILRRGNADLHRGLCGGRGYQANGQNHAERYAECKAGETEFGSVHCGFLK